MSLDEMLAHLDAWDRTADRRMAQRRIAALARRESERRSLADDRRAPPGSVEPPPSTEAAADVPAAGPARPRDAASASAEVHPSRHAH
jgi:hypothetical protein